MIRGLLHGVYCRQRTTSWSLAIFELLNRVFCRLGWKARRSIPIFCTRDRKSLFYLRLGTTDFETFQVTFLRSEYKFVEDKLRGLRRIIDLGANIGDSTRYLAESFPDALILAVEPDPENYKVCLKNLRETPKASAKQCFVGGFSGAAGLDRSGGEWGYAMQRTGTTEEIPVVTMATLLKEVGWQSVDLVKCDIEGAEQEVFENCSDWIERVAHIAVETAPPYGVSKLEDALARSGQKFEKRYHSAPDGFHELALFSRATPNNQPFPLQDRV